MKPSEEKAVKLVLEKRVTIKYASLDGLAAQGSVDGYNDVYEASYSPAGYVCTCPAGQNHRVCSHARALELEVHRRLERVAV